MAINFPNSPTLDDEYTDPTTDIVWKWDGSSWERIFEDFNFSQKVGIGTVDPQEEIHVKAQVPVIRLEDTDGGYMQIVGSDGNIRFDADNAGSISGSNILFNIDNSPRMIIDASGRVGIGTTSPTNVLSINGRADFDRIVLNNAYQAGTENWIISTGDTGTIAGSSGYTHNGGIGLFANAAYHSSGNFSLQDTSTLSASAISVQEDGHIRFAAVDGLSSTTNVTLLSSYTRMTIDPSGNVGIGTQSPSSKLDIGLTSSFNKISGKYIDYRGVGNGTNEGYLLLVPASTTSAGKFVGTIVADRGNINNGNENMKAHFNVSVAYNVNRGMLELFGNADHYFKKLVIVTFSGVDYIAAYFNQTGGGPANGIFVEDAIVAGLDANCLTMKYGSEINAMVDSNFGSIVSNISGNVGIGITSPASELDVDGVIRAGNTSSVYGGTALRVPYHVAGNHSANFGAAQSSGAPLIGYAVESHQSAHDTFVSTANNVDWKRAALVVGSDLEFWNGIGQDTAVGSNASMVRRFIVNESGNVGIGTAASTANPTSKLHVSGPNTDIVAGLISSTDVDLSMIAYQSSHAEIRVSSNHDLLFKTNGNNERMRITSGGDVEILNDVGINGVLTMNSTSQYQLNLSGSNDGKILLTGVNPYMRFRESATSTVDKSYIQWHSGGYLYLRNQEDSSGLRIKGDLDFTLDGTTFHSVYHEGNFTPTWTAGTGLIYYNSGDVGIGTIPSYELHVRKDQASSTNFAIQNHNVHAYAAAQLFVETKSGGGDPQIQFQIDGVESYTVGIDNSDSDKFKISDYGSLGTNDRLTIDSSGSIAMGNSTSATGSYSTAMGDTTTASGAVSTAMGYNTTASGGWSFAAGYNSSASEDYSISMGKNSIASKENAIAIGKDAEATELSSVAIGNGATASGQYSFASGGNEASGVYSTAFGNATKATNFFATSLGFTTEANGSASLATGHSCKADGVNSTAMGDYMHVSGEGSFGIGLSNPGSNTSWSLTQNYTMAIMGGNVGIGTVTPSEKLVVDGNISATGNVILDGIVENFGTYSNNISSTPTIPFDASVNKILRITSNTISSNWKINVTNLSLNVGQITNLTIVLESGTGTSYIPDVFQIGGVNKTIKWQGGSVPTGLSNPTGAPVNIYSFTVFRTSSSDYTVIGNHVSFDG